MKEILLSLYSIFTINSISHPEINNYNPEISNKNGKDSHAVMPGDLSLANCLSSDLEQLDRKQMYSTLRGLGHNISQYINDSRFSDQHIRDIYKAIMLIPKWQYIGSNLLSVSATYHIEEERNAVASMKDSKLYINPRRWTMFDSDMRTSIIYHELSHLLGHRLFNIDDSKTWEKIDGGWKVKSTRRDGSIYEGFPLISTNLVSNYAMTNPAEDFSESVSSYRIKPQALKDASPKRYEFIKNAVFLGQEFIDESMCEFGLNELMNTVEVEESIKALLNTRPHHFSRAYDYAWRKRRGQNKDRLHVIFLSASLSSLINSMGEGANTSVDDFALKNSIRSYVKSLSSLEELKRFHTSQSQSLVRKLLR
jgi:hypothetical protein